MNLMPVAERLESATLGVRGKTIFINMIPAEAPKGILLRNDLRGTHIDHELPGYYKGFFQLIVRAPNYTAGEELIKEAIAALTVVETQVGTQHFRYIRPKTLPVVFPLSKGALLEFSVHMDCCFTE